MPRIIRNAVYNVLWDFFRSLFRIQGDFDCGTISLSHGKWVLFIDTADRPANVWLSVVGGESSLPVCGGSTTLLGTSLTKNGFYLFADVRSNDCQIDWFTSEY